MEKGEELPAKRECLPQPDDLQTQVIPQESSPCSSPVAPTPEPLSPILEKRACESSTYRYIKTKPFAFTTSNFYSHAYYSSFINLISDDESEWASDPAVQLILKQSIEGTCSDQR